MQFSKRVNEWLSEPEGEQFRVNKWKFWFVALIAFSILNAALTALVFNAGGVLQTYMGTVLVGVGALLAWLGVCALYYSDSTDAHLSRGVAVLDSVTLLFVVAHFSFLFWVYGHLSTLQKAEADYAVAIAKHSASAKTVQESNAKIMEALQAAEASRKETARIEADTAYQYRKASDRGVKIRRDAGGITANIELAKVEMAKPPDPPPDSSSAYLTRWDSWIRLANFGELALAIATLIFIRVRSSLTNSPREEEFPREIDVEKRSPARRLELVPKTTTRGDIVDDTHSHQKTTRAGLRELREALKLIAFEHPPGHFKVDVKDDYLIIRRMESNRGDEATTHSVKAKLSLLDDAVRMPRDKFRERLERFLRQSGFEI